jgi:GAF domain-containing protein/HAMP domain-containing protein
MTTTLSRTTDGEATRAAYTLRVAVVLLIAALATTVLYVVLTAQYPVWQMLAVAVALAALMLMLLVAIVLTRRGHATGGAWLTIVGMLVVIQVPSALVADVGPLLGLASFVATAAIALMTLPQSSVARALSGAFVAALAAGLLGLYAPIGKVAVPLIATVSPLIVVVTLVLYFAIILRRFQTFSTRTKLIVVFLIVMLAPLSVVSLLNGRSSQDALIRAARQALLTAAEQTAADVDDFLVTNLNTVRVEARFRDLAEMLEHPDDEDAAQDVVSYLASLAARDPAIESYALLNRQGLNVADTQASSAGTDESGREYFEMPLTTGQTYLSPVQTWPEAGRPSLTFSSPVQGEEGNTLGVLRLRYRADEFGVLQEIVALRSGMAGDRSYGVLFDDYHVRLAHGVSLGSVFRAVAPFEDEAHIAALQAAGRLPDLRAVELATNYPDQEQGLSNAPEQPFFESYDIGTGAEIDQVAVAQLGAQPWLMAFFQPSEVSLALAEEQARSSTLVGIVIAGVAVVAAMRFSQVLAEPIIRLTDVAERVSAGDLTAQARIEGSDEVGTLANAFNSMTKQLRTFIDSLELRVEARTAQLQTSADVGRAAVSILDPEQLMREAVNLISDRFGYYYAALFTLDEAGRYAVLREATGEAGRALKAQGHKLEVGGHSMVGFVTAQRKPRIALDVGEEAVRFANPLLPETRSEIALPLAVGDRVLGALDVQSTQAAAFDQATASVLQAMADQVAVALNNAALFVASRRNVEALNGLLSLSRDLASSRSLDDLRVRARNYVRTIVGCDNYYVALVDEARVEVRFILQVRPDQSASGVVTRPFGNGRTEYVVRTRQVLRMSTAEAPARLAQLGLHSAEPQPGAFLGVPIVIGERVLGMLGLQNFDPDAAFGDHHVQLVTALAGQFAVTLDNLRLADETQRALADLDAANRLLTEQAWQRHRRDRRPLSYEWRGGKWSPLRATSQAENGAPSAGTPITIPVKVRGLTIGEFDLLPAAGQPDWSPDEFAFAQSLVDEVSQTLETVRLLEETERLAGRERLINEINARVRQTVNVDTILQTAVNELGRSLRAARVFARINAPSTDVDDDRTPFAGNGRGDDHA